MTNQPQDSQDHRKQIGKILAVTITLLLIPLLLFLLSTLPAHAQTAKPAPTKPSAAKHYTDLTFPPLPEIKLPKYDRFQLKNGLVVYLMEDKELPLVSGSAIIRSGSKLDAVDKVGLSSIMATVMRSGGTKAHSGDQLDQILEQQAASIESSMGNSSGGASFSALSENLPQVLALFSEVLQQPAFPEDKINLAKFQIKGGIARRNDDPGEIMGREFRKLIYGDTSPYARQVEYKTIANVTRQDLVDRYNATYRPENMILGIVGDFDSKTLKPQIEKLLGNWRNPNPPMKATEGAIAQAKTSGTFFVNQDQLNQSYIRMGHLGGRFDSPDYPALSVMNEVLSSFGGRLFNEIRSRQGLAYSVYAAWSPQFDIPGIFISGGETRSEATVAFVKSMRQEIERIRTQPVSAAELQVAKDGVLNSFIFNFEDPAQTLSRLMRYEYFGYPSDFIFRYQKAVEKTTVADVQRVAKQYLQPDKLVTIVVGSQGAIKPSLAELGKVQAIDVTIPKP
jgi:zinc protease